MKLNAFKDDDEFSDLEFALRGRPGPEPSDALHDRVMSDVGRALSQRVSAPPKPRTWAGDLVGWAAVLIVGLALSQIASSRTAFLGRPPAAPPAGTVRAAADLLRHVSPGLTRDEAGRLTLVGAWQRDLLPVPIVNGNETTWPRADWRPAFDGDSR